MARVRVTNTGYAKYTILLANVYLRSPPSIILLFGLLLLLLDFLLLSSKCLWLVVLLIIQHTRRRRTLKVVKAVVPAKNFEPNTRILKINREIIQQVLSTLVSLNGDLPPPLLLLRLISK